MKNIIAITTVAILTLALSCFPTLYAQVSQKQQLLKRNQANLESEPAERPRPRMDSVKTVNFYLKNGRLVFGKLVSEDRNKVTVEQLNESRIVVSVYGKRDIDIRTLRTKNVLEYRYYIDLAEYFHAKTWDFRDDPDDFIQAIRCYEKAKQLLLETQNQDSEKTEQINEKITQLQTDRQVWTREVQSRLKLKSLELEVAVESRLKELEDKFDTNSRQINETIERLDNIITGMENNQRTLGDNISEIDKNVSRQLRTLQDQIETNRRLINRLSYFWDYYPPERRE